MNKIKSTFISNGLWQFPILTGVIVVIGLSIVGIKDKIGLQLLIEKVDLVLYSLLYSFVLVLMTSSILIRIDDKYLYIKYVPLFAFRNKKIALCSIDYLGLKRVKLGMALRIYLKNDTIIKVEMTELREKPCFELKNEIKRRIDLDSKNNP